MVDQVNNGLQTFVDMNGDPLSGGLVYMYIPNTATFSMTWSDAAGTVQNTNPIVLDQAGRASIWGAGEYRQVVTDQFGNVQWDRVTAAGNQQNVTGVVQGDLNVTGNAIINQNLTVGGGLNITGGETVAGATTVQGLLTANSGATVNGTFTTNGNAAITGTLSVDSSSGSTDLMRGDKIVVTSGNSPGIAFANTADGLTMGWWEASDELRCGVTDGTTGEPVSTLIGIGGTGPGIMRTAADISVGGISGEAHTVIIHSGSSPSFACHNTVDNVVMGMWEAASVLQWGTLDTNGNPGSSLMRLDTSGDLGVLANILPIVNNTAVGTPAQPWTAMYSHNFVTVSTEVASSPLTGGQLDVVKNVTVRTEPHIGISADDAKVIKGAVPEGGIGTSYAVLLGVLWKALQELSADFDAYKAAHP